MKGKVHRRLRSSEGIEYDTLDTGHIICIMPEGVKMRLLEVKGLPVSVLIDFVHRHGWNLRTCTSMRRKVPELYEYQQIL